MTNTNVNPNADVIDTDGTNVTPPTAEVKRSYNTQAKSKLFFKMDKRQVLESMGLTVSSLTDDELIQVYNRITNFMSIPVYVKDEALRQEYQTMVLDVMATIVGGTIRTTERSVQFVPATEKVELTLAEKKSQLESTMGMPEGSFRSLGVEAVDIMFNQHFATDDVYLTFKPMSGNPNDWRLAVAVGATEDELAEEVTE